MTLPPRLLRLKDEAGDFLSWWWEELEASLPLRLRQKLGRRSTSVTIRPLRTSVEIDLVTGADGRTLREDAPLAAMDDAAWVQLEELMTDRRCRIRLGDRDVFRTQLSLPAAAARNVAPAVSTRLPLLSPLRGEEMEHGWHARPADGGGIEVGILIAKRTTLDSIDRLFDMRGIVTPPVEALYDGSPVILRRGRERLWSRARRRERLSMMAAALLVASIPVTIWIASGIAVFFNERSLEGLRAQVAPVSAAARRAALADGRRRALAPLARQGFVSPVIDDLAVALPQTVYLESFRYNGEGDVGFTLGGDLQKDTPGEIQKSAQLFELDPFEGGDDGIADFHARLR